MFSLPVSETEIVSTRPAKNRLDPWKPYFTLIEPECSAEGQIEDVLTIFLTNKECPFHCTMCDLWRNTLDERVPVGAIPAQIVEARSCFPVARHIKLYNAGNFFDPQAIPPEDHLEIARLVQPFKTVIVENHPRLTDDRCIQFRDKIGTNLEIALGLETVHSHALANLNKRMTVADFDRAAQFLIQHKIAVRTFLLLKPPGLDEDLGLEWVLRSLKHAVEMGASCVSMIPTRGGNGIMEHLQTAGDFSPPSIRSMEQALEQGLNYARTVSPTPRVFMDVWDSARFFDCPHCGPMRSLRIQNMNHSQRITTSISCGVCKR